MAGGSFMHRVMSYVVNEILVNSLANNRSFQRFAVRTSRKIEDLSKTVSEKKDVFKDFSKNVQENLKNRE
ncbi:hypothetical protein RND81_08G156100 [Saponaria officinalis]|uniref:Uncharacterized protein n=1 Tax=Saponaria officinalis TaxID=3572 RepID=A0AAW1J8V0_SAPOF